MRKKSKVMPGMRNLWIGLAIILASTSTASAADVELGAVGDDAPNFMWCNKAQHKVKIGAPFRVVLTGRSTISQEVTGRINLANDSNARFEWVEVLDGDPDERPRLDFTPTMAPLRGTIHPLIAKVGILPGMYYLEFVAEDAHESVALPARGCMVEVVKELPDVEVTDLRYDPPQPGVAGRTVRMTIKNDMPSTASALQGVPWTISLIQALVAPVGGTRFIESQVTSGMLVNVLPGSTRQVTAPINMPGDRNISSADRIIGRVDPFNFLGENEAARVNNQKWLALEMSAVPVTQPPPHTCEEGFEEVTTTDGSLGCAKISTAPPSCNGFWESVRGFFTGSCSVGSAAFRCASNSDCANGYICPQSGSSSGNCTEGHIP